MTCRITGAVAFNGHAWVGGDLHQIDTAWVFNCVMHQSNGDAMWAERESWSHLGREVDFSSSEEYWERRGTIVASALGTRLNPAAEEYLNGSR